MKEKSIIDILNVRLKNIRDSLNIYVDISKRPEIPLEIEAHLSHQMQSYIVIQEFSIFEKSLKLLTEKLVCEIPNRYDECLNLLKEDHVHNNTNFNKWAPGLDYGKFLNRFWILNKTIFLNKKLSKESMITVDQIFRNLKEHRNSFAHEGKNVTFDEQLSYLPYITGIIRLLYIFFEIPISGDKDLKDYIEYIDFQNFLMEKVSSAYTCQIDLQFKNKKFQNDFQNDIYKKKLKDFLNINNMNVINNQTVRDFFYKIKLEINEENFLRIIYEAYFETLCGKKEIFSTINYKESIEYIDKIILQNNILLDFISPIQNNQPIYKKKKKCMKYHNRVKRR